MSTTSQARDKNPEDELKAMQSLVDAFVPLTPDEISRVVRWAADRYDVTITVRTAEEQNR